MTLMRHSYFIFQDYGPGYDMVRLMFIKPDDRPKDRYFYFIILADRGRSQTRVANEYRKREDLTRNFTYKVNTYREYDQLQTRLNQK